MTQGKHLTDTVQCTTCLGKCATTFSTSFFKIRTHLEKKILRFVLISLRYFVTKFENSVKAMFIVTYHLLLKLKMWSLQDR